MLTDSPFCSYLSFCWNTASAFILWLLRGQAELFQQQICGGHKVRKSLAPHNRYATMHIQNSHFITTLSLSIACTGQDAAQSLCMWACAGTHGAHAEMWNLSSILQACKDTFWTPQPTKMGKGNIVYIEHRNNKRGRSDGSLFHSLKRNSTAIKNGTMTKFYSTVRKLKLLLY